MDSTTLLIILNLIEDSHKLSLVLTIKLISKIKRIQAGNKEDKQIVERAISQQMNSPTYNDISLLNISSAEYLPISLKIESSLQLKNSDDNYPPSQVNASHQLSQENQSSFNFSYLSVGGKEQAQAQLPFSSETEVRGPSCKIEGKNFMDSIQTNNSSASKVNKVYFSSGGGFYVRDKHPDYLTELQREQSYSLNERSELQEDEQLVIQEGDDENQFLITFGSTTNLNEKQQEISKEYHNLVDIQDDKIKSQLKENDIQRELNELSMQNQYNSFNSEVYEQDSYQNIKNKQIQALREVSNNNSNAKAKQKSVNSNKTPYDMAASYQKRVQQFLASRENQQKKVPLASKDQSTMMMSYDSRNMSIVGKENQVPNRKGSRRVSTAYINMSEIMGNSYVDNYNSNNKKQNMNRHESSICTKGTKSPNFKKQSPVSQKLNYQTNLITIEQNEPITQYYHYNQMNECMKQQTEPINHFTAESTVRQTNCFTVDTELELNDSSLYWNFSPDERKSTRPDQVPKLNLMKEEDNVRQTTFSNKNSQMFRSRKSFDGTNNKRRESSQSLEFMDRCYKKNVMQHLKDTQNSIGYLAQQMNGIKRKMSIQNRK